MQSYPDDLDEAFQYLSREMLAPEVTASDLQQVPTPPVRFVPLPWIFATAANLTLFCVRYRPRTSSRLVPWSV